MPSVLRPAGFTLVEALTVLAVAALLLVAAVPQYSDWRGARLLANEAERLAASMNFARAEAIKRGYRVNLCPSRDRQSCAVNGDWGGGWIVYVDRNRNGQVNDDEPRLRAEPGAPAAIRVTANHPVAAYVSYTGRGNARLLDGALQMGTFTWCQSGQQARKLVLANSGRVRLETASEVCL